MSHACLLINFDLVAELQFQARADAQQEPAVDFEVPVVEQLVHVTAQQQAVVDAVDAAIPDRPDVGRFRAGSTASR